GGARMLHAISITQRYPGHAVQTAHVAAQCGASAYASKYVVVVDEDVDVTNLDHLLWAMLTRTDPKESIQFITGSLDSSADPALPPEPRAVGHMTHSVQFIDACKPFHWRDKFPPTNAPSPEVVRRAREKFGWLLDGNGREVNQAVPFVATDLEKALVFRNALFVGSIAALAANNITPQRQPSVGAARESRRSRRIKTPQSTRERTHDHSQASQGSAAGAGCQQWPA